MTIEEPSIVAVKSVIAAIWFARAVASVMVESVPVASCEYSVPFTVTVQMSLFTTVPLRVAVAEVGVAVFTVALPEPVVPAVTTGIAPEMRVMVIVTVLPVTSNEAA